MRVRLFVFFLCALALPARQAPPAAPEPAETAPTQRPVKPAGSDDDPGRPVLRRGGPAEKREGASPAAKSASGSPTVNSSGARTETPAPQAPIAAPARPIREVEVDDAGNSRRVSQPAQAQAKPSSQDLIERARAAAAEFDSTLPSFICDQLTMRYQSQSMKPDWRYQDRVEVELLYRTGREDYRNVRVNGKPLRKGSPEDSGTWSNGEFGSLAADILSPVTNARFTLRGGSSAAGVEAKVYDFSVAQANSHWTIRYGTALRPAYRGSIWLDPKTARVLRVEINSRQMPSSYAIDTVEVAVDYGWTVLSGKRFLLPLKSENLACVRGTTNCMKNEIEFRNYRKFDVESQVLQVESDIVFPEEESEKPKPETIPPTAPPAAAKKKQP